MGLPIDELRPGDHVKVRYRGERWRGVWLFRGADDTTVRIRRESMASGRILKRSDVELIDADARWPKEVGS